jgi:hypothetical protein
MDREAMRANVRVRVTSLLASERSVNDLKNVVLEQNFKPRREGAIGTISKGIPGISGDAVIVQHEDDDGHGLFNGESAAYYACELEPFS